MLLSSIVGDTFHGRDRREHIKSEEKNWDESISPCLADRRNDGDPAAGEEENLTTERTESTERIRGA